VRAVPEGFEIGPAGQCRTDLDENLARLEFRNRYLLQTNVLFPVQNRRLHDEEMASARVLDTPAGWLGLTITLRDSAEGRLATAIASWICSRTN